MENFELYNIKLLEDITLNKLIELVNNACEKLNINYNRIIIEDIIREQPLLLGACDIESKTLRFSNKLIFAPDFFLKDIAIHETCHLIELGHEESFAKLYYSLQDDNRECNKWYNQYLENPNILYQLN